MKKKNTHILKKSIYIYRRKPTTKDYDGLKVGKKNIIS